MFSRPLPARAVSVVRARLFSVLSLFASSCSTQNNSSDSSHVVTYTPISSHFLLPPEEQPLRLLYCWSQAQDCGIYNARVATQRDRRTIWRVVHAVTVITLTWTDIAEGTAAEDGFKVERKETGGVYQQIGETAANATSYTDTTWQPNKQYLYRVFAFNKWGQSGYSNEAGIGTSTPGTPSNLEVNVTVNVTVSTAKGNVKAGAK